MTEDPPELDNSSYRHALTNISKNNLSLHIHLVKVDETSDSRSTLPEELAFNFDQLFNSKNHIPNPHAYEAEETDDAHRTGVLDIQFTMCNPPFYNSTHEVALSAAGKEDSPFGVRYHLSFPTRLVDQLLLFHRFVPVRRLK